MHSRNSFSNELLWKKIFKNPQKISFHFFFFVMFKAFDCDALSQIDF